MTRILCIEDNEIEGRAIVALASHQGWDVDLAVTAEDALEMVRATDYSVVLVDWRLPGSVSGLDFCRRVRKGGYRRPIIFVSALAGADDKATAFEVGADDYVQKPFDATEFCARIRAHLRRSAWFEEEPYSTTDSALAGANVEEGLTIRWGPFAAHVGDRVFVNGVGCRLTNRQERVLVRLLRKVGQVVTNAEIWEDFDVARPADLVNIRALIYSLRKRLGSTGRYIESFRGVGYGIAANDHSAEE